MDPSFKLRKFFLEISIAFKRLKTQEKIKNQRKLLIVKELEDDLFYMKESAKKMLRARQIKIEDYEKINEKIKKIKKELEFKKIELTNL